MKDIIHEKRKKNVLQTQDEGHHTREKEEKCPSNPDERQPT